MDPHGRRSGDEPSTSTGTLELVRRSPLVVFFLLAFALTWAVWIPRAMGVEFGAISRLWTWMAAAAAVLAAALTGGRTAVRQLFRRLLRWRVGWHWYLVVILGPAAFSAAIAAVYVLLGGSWSAAAPDAFTTSLPMLGLFLLALTFTDGLGEEPAWRGFALPRLLSRFNALIASLVLGVLWGAWHLPLIWTAGSALQSQPVWLLLLDISAKSVLFTWVFLRTRGSALVAVLLHGTSNLFEVSPVVGSAGELAYPVLAAAGKWVLVAILVAWAGPRLTRRPSPEALAQPAEQAH